jgi:threonylcarbamoyladenosine tRNA methylthiotransferase MtaB
VTRELIDAMADNVDKVCPHLHISMQSGSDSVLRRMRRRWGSRRYIDRCELLKERLDRPAITTDIIVGFPGETDAEFAETVAVARAVGFSKVHIFPFSPRRGTPAATMPNQVPAPMRDERARELAAVETELRDEYFQSLRGRRLRVLVEGKAEGGRGKAEGGALWLGTSCRYAPVQLAANSSDVGRLIEVIASEARDGFIVAA